MDNPFQGTLLVCDMDGTLLNSEHKISLENKEAIRRFVDGGGMFTVATGRRSGGVAEVVKGLPMNLPVILLNGSQIYDLGRDCSLENFFIREDLSPLLKSIKAAFPDVGIEVFIEEGIAVVNDNQQVDFHRKLEPILPGIIEIDDLPQPWFKVIFAGDNDRLLEVEDHLRAFSGTWRAVFSAVIFLEILDREASKGNSIKKMVELLSLDVKRIVTMGDNMNDLEMIQIADHGVAVENANDRLKEAADFCVGHHDDHAVAQVIEMLEKGSPVLYRQRGEGKVY